MEIPDPDLYKWFTSEDVSIPEKYTALVKEILNKTFMMLDDFIKEFSKNEEKKNKGSILGNIPHGSEALIISKISEYIKKDILFICENKKKYNQIKDVLNFLEIKKYIFFLNMTLILTTEYHQIKTLPLKE